MSSTLWLWEISKSWTNWCTIPSSHVSSTKNPNPPKPDALSLFPKAYPTNSCKSMREKTIIWTRWRRRDQCWSTHFIRRREFSRRKMTACRGFEATRNCWQSKSILLSGTRLCLWIRDRPLTCQISFWSSSSKSLSILTKLRPQRLPLSPKNSTSWSTTLPCFIIEHWFLERKTSSRMRKLSLSSARRSRMRTILRWQMCLRCWMSLMRPNT